MDWDYPQVASPISRSTCVSPEVIVGFVLLDQNENERRKDRAGRVVWLEDLEQCSTSIDAVIVERSRRRPEDLKLLHSEDSAGIAVIMVIVVILWCRSPSHRYFCTVAK